MKKDGPVIFRTHLRLSEDARLSMIVYQDHTRGDPVYFATGWVSARKLSADRHKIDEHVDYLTPAGAVLGLFKVAKTIIEKLENADTSKR